jgi:hypothetical protein
VADTLQIVDFPYVGSRDRLIFDLADITHYAYAQGSLKPTAGDKGQVFSGGDSRWGGARQVDEKVGNGSLSWTVHVRGTSADDLATRMEDYLEQMDARTRGRYIKWRHGGASGVSRAVFSPVRGSATYAFDYDSLKLQGAWACDAQITVPVAPLAEWLCCDIEDRLDQDTIALGDWSALVGAGTFTVDTTARTWTPTATGRQVIQHSGRGYSFTDWDTGVLFTWRGTTGAPDVQGLCKIVSCEHLPGRASRRHQPGGVRRQGRHHRRHRDHDRRGAHQRGDLLAARAAARPRRHRHRVGPRPRPAVVAVDRVVHQVRHAR